ncbi:uncharacterized protein LOC119996992 [Tripterygium wilfordii]|nr:uncharacterized protein LOC119996992 [Tripterygium wilfordii]
MSMLFSAGLAQLVPLPPLPPLPPGVGANPQCWSVSLQGCVVDIFVSLSSGKIGSIDTACCNAITHIEDDCWPKLFPSNPVFPNGLKTFCAAPPSLRPSIAKKLEIEILKEQTEIKQCWSSIANISGCVEEIFELFTSGKIGGFGPACCKAIITLSDKCWTKLFPINPFFPPLIKSKCGAKSGVSPPPE